MIKTHYDNLQVTRNASPEVIRGAYKYLTQKWHPDKNPDNRTESERVLKLVNRAYEVLSNSQLREEHDRWIMQQEKIESQARSDSNTPDPVREPFDSSRTMNAVKGKMQEALIKAGKGAGTFAGVSCFFLLSVLSALIPGVPELMRNHNWPALLILGFSIAVGWLVGEISDSNRRQRVCAYDDEILKYEYDQLRDKKTRSAIGWGVIIILAGAYFFLKDL